MKSLMQLWMCVLDELGTQIGTNTSRDRKTATTRFEHEGVSFLTITLPNFGADLQKGLSRGWIAHDLFQGFSWTGGLPRFLRGFLELVFECGSGKLLDDPDVDAIFALRQLTLMMGKVSIPCSDTRVRNAIDGYIKTEGEVRDFDAQRTLVDYERFSYVSSLLFARVLTGCDLRVYQEEHMPKHGPGSTADKLSGNRKYLQTEWTERLEGVFPSLTFLTPGWKYFNTLDHVTYLTPEQERPVRVITVPKTLKTPRIIAIEPTCMQYTQQALLEVFLEELREDDLLSQFLRFDDQSFNQTLAQKGSVDGSLATLDLSEASDRVSNQLVREMLRRHPHFAEGVDSCRSRKADVPDHGVIRLAKYASMGSALCFPMEAMVFLTVIFLGIQKELNHPLTRRIISTFVGQVCVYGDDLIVPTRFVPAVVSELEAFGFRVNASKSFWTGKFRESCGKDYYDGSDVSIARVRKLFPTRRAHVAEMISMVSLRNQLYKLGLWKTCQWIDQHIEVLLNGNYPVVAETSAVLGRHSVLGYQSERMHPSLHSPLVRGYVARARLPISKLDGESALLKFLLKRGKEPLDQGHLERAGRAEVVNLNLGWFSPF